MLTPEGFKILKIVFSTIEIHEDENTPTAEIHKGNGFYYIKMGKRFKEKFIKTQEDYYFVLIHEYLHTFLSHFYLGKYYSETEKENKALLNFIFDSIVNYFIAKNLLLREPPLLKKLYKNLPYSLYMFLNPYELVKKGKLRGKPLAFLKKKKVHRADEVKLWINSFLYSGEEDIHGFISFMKSYLKENFARIYHNIIFIDRLKEFSEKIPSFLKEFWEKRAGYNEDEEIDKIKIKQGDKFSEETITAFKMAIKRVLAKGKGFINDFKIEKTKSIVPFPGRKEFVFIKKRIYPVFFKRPIRYTVPDNKRPRIYIDVSDSTSELWPFIYGICYFLKNSIGEPIYLFSNKVYEITLEEMKSGKVRTTGGTDFDCVVNHILKNGFKKALLITDGCAGLSSNLKDELLKKQVEIYVILIENYLMREYYTLKSIAKKMWCVDFK